MAELHFKIKNTLVKMDFIRRYEELAGHFSSERTPSDERLVYVERDEVMSIIRDLGYSSMFHSKEKFYKITEEQAGAFTFGFHIILRDGMAGFVWVVRGNDFHEKFG